MASSPRIVTSDINVVWDGVTTFVPKGTIVDIPPGSAQETAYGLSNLLALGASSAQVLSGDTEPEEDTDAGSPS